MSIVGPTRNQDQVWLVMELCDGGSISELVLGLKKRQMGPLNESEIAYILREVNNALAYLHGHHRIHRDVKGTNILLNKEGLQFWQLFSDFFTFFFLSMKQF
jgi:myosin-3